MGGAVIAVRKKENNEVDDAFIINIISMQKLT
jgi:hypothetical protein